jgi:hypothetical protein
MFPVTILLQHPVSQTRIVLECPSDLIEHRFGPSLTILALPPVNLGLSVGITLESLTSTNTNPSPRIMQSPVLMPCTFAVSVLSASQEGIMLATWIATLIDQVRKQYGASLPLQVGIYLLIAYILSLNESANSVQTKCPMKELSSQNRYIREIT